MKTFLIPVDFSDVSYTAAQYAVDMAAQLHAEHILLYHSYAHRPPEGYDENTGYEPATLKHLEKVIAKLRIPYPLSDARFSCFADDLPVKDGVVALVAQHRVSMIVMGIAGLSDMENTLVGRNTMAVAASGAAPVLIVPRNHSFIPIHRLLYATDLKDVADVTPAVNIVRMAIQLEAKTYIIHVDPATKGQTPTKLAGKKLLLEVLAPISPRFEVIGEATDPAEGISDYAKEHGIDLILMASRNYGFFERLFHSSVSKKLLNIADVPVLLLKNEPVS